MQKEGERHYKICVQKNRNKHEDLSTELNIRDASYIDNSSKIRDDDIQMITYLQITFWSIALSRWHVWLSKHSLWQFYDNFCQQYK